VIPRLGIEITASAASGCCGTGRGAARSPRAFPGSGLLTAGLVIGGAYALQQVGRSAFMVALLAATAGVLPEIALAACAAAVVAVLAALGHRAQLDLPGE